MRVKKRVSYLNLFLILLLWNLFKKGHLSKLQFNVTTATTDNILTWQCLVHVTRIVKIPFNTSKKLSSAIKQIIFKEDLIQKIPVTTVRGLTMPVRKKGNNNNKKTLTEITREKKQFKGYQRGGGGGFGCVSPLWNTQSTLWLLWYSLGK